MLSLLFLLACGSGSDGPPPRPDGTFAVLSVEMSGAEVDGRDVVTGRFPGCTWGQETLTFRESSMQVDVAVLCPQKGGVEAYGCEVGVTAAATWDAARGVFVVPHAVQGKGQFLAIRETGPSKALTGCDYTLEAGEWPVARVRNGSWKWEVRSPSGTVHRLDKASSEPDFATAMLELTKEE